jgi:hypothetical protein
LERRRFALDQNFPEPIVLAIVKAVPAAELVPVREIDPSLAEVEDWELLVALRRHPSPWDGLITNDAAMLAQAKEMAILQQTGLTLVIARGEGSNPIRAAGVLLCHLNHICHHTKRDVAQIWNLRVSQKDAEEPTGYLSKIAERQRITVEHLVREHRVAALVPPRGNRR